MKPRSTSTTKPAGRVGGILIEDLKNLFGVLFGHRKFLNKFYPDKNLLLIVLLAALNYYRTRPVAATLPLNAC
jgi:membrane-bound metal-dependent hydrolase YbcI (DUF457 family)